MRKLVDVLFLFCVLLWLPEATSFPGLFPSRGGKSPGNEVVPEVFLARNEGQVGLDFRKIFFLRVLNSPRLWRYKGSLCAN